MTGKQRASLLTARIALGHCTLQSLFPFESFQAVFGPLRYISSIYLTAPSFYIMKSCLL